MAKVLVRIPVGVILPGVPEQLECEGSTVAEVLSDCAARQPRLQSRLFRKDGSPWVGVSLNGGGVPPDAIASVAVGDGDKIRLIPPVGAC